jgi:nucleotide-binding universal stress UspA family protein
VIQRILVAFDASPSSLAALQTAAELAAQLEAELFGLFVEDVDLLRFSDAPYAREILFPSAAEVPVTRASMECSLRAQSQRVRETVAAVARAANVAWRFRSVCGRVTEEVMAAAGDADLLAIGRSGWSLGGRDRIGSTAQELMTGPVPVLLLPERASLSQFHLVVYFDATPRARKVLLAAADLAGACKRGLTVLLAAPDLKVEVESILRRRVVEARYRQIDPRDEMNLRRAMQQESGGILVLGRHQGLDRLKTLESVVGHNDVPVLLLDGG